MTRKLDCSSIREHAWIVKDKMLVLQSAKLPVHSVDQSFVNKCFFFWSSCLGLHVLTDKDKDFFYLNNIQLLQ